MKFFYKTNQNSMSKQFETKFVNVCQENESNDSRDPYIILNEIFDSIIERLDSSKEYQEICEKFNTSIDPYLVDCIYTFVQLKCPQYEEFEFLKWRVTQTSLKVIVRNLKFNKAKLEVINELYHDESKQHDSENVVWDDDPSNVFDNLITAINRIFEEKHENQFTFKLYFDCEIDKTLFTAIEKTLNNPNECDTIKGFQKYNCTFKFIDTCLIMTAIINE